MASYAEIKGQPIKAAPVNRSTATAPAGELSDEEIQRIAENRDFVKQHMPELVDFIKGLHEAGMINGWRAVTHCKLLERSK